MNINVNSLEADAVLKLYPLHLPGSIQTVQPPGYADRGVPRSIYSAIQPLAIVVDPLVMLANSKNGALGGVLEAYDTVTVWVNGVATGASDYVRPGKESERMLLHLQPGWFNDGVNTMRYRVQRLSGNNEDSLPLKVLYYNPASGVTVSHPPSVGPGQTGPITITISYPRPYGTVTLTIGNWSITFNNFDDTKPIIYHLTLTDLQQIGDGTHPVSAIHIDQLTNSNVSPTTSIVITANTLVLRPPTVTGQTGNNFNPTLQNVEVVVPAGTLLPSDKVHVVWEGAISAPGASFTSPQRLVSAGLKFVVPRSVLAYSLGKGVKVTYVIERNGVLTSSQVLPLNILPLPATALIPPKILEANANNVLDVTALGTKNATNHALLWTLIADGMPCWLSLEGKNADGTVVNLPLWNGLPARVNPTWVSQGFWPQVLENSFLKELGDGTSLIIKFAVSMDMSNVRATAVEFPDRVYTIKAVALIAPTIVNVNENTATGKPVANAGTTTATTLVISGKLSPGQQGELYDGSGASAKPLGKVTANAAGDYSITITVAQGAHRFYIQSLYHPGTVYSNVWTLTVVALVIPTIVNVNENNANGKPVANAGTTTVPTLFFRGKLSPHQQGELYDGSGATAKPLGKVTANAAGDYSITITAAQGAHRFYIQSLYHPGNVYSNVWTLTVVALVNATITKVNENTATGALVAHGASTHAIRLVITGTANAGENAELRDNNSVIDTFVVDAKGDFQRTVTGQAVGNHNYRVRELGNGTESAIRSLTVVAWRDSITDFNNGTSGGWLKGPAGFQGAIAGGVFRNLTPAHTGHAGVLFSQSFQLVGGSRYSFSYRVRNISPQPPDLAPSFSVSTSSGLTILPVFNVPRNSQWYTQSNVFSVTTSGTYRVNLVSHQDRGGGNNGDGGNDYEIDDLIMRWVS